MKQHEAAGADRSHFFYPVQLVGVFRSSAIGEDERSESATAGGLYIW